MKNKSIKFSLTRKLFTSLIACSSLSAFANSRTIIAGVPHNAKHTPFVEVYAHRGSRAYSPENTIPAYKTGLSIGVDWVDMDIGLTKDNVVVVTHDLSLNPAITRNKKNEFLIEQPRKNYPQDAIDTSSTIPYLIHDLTFAQLEQYDVGRLNKSIAYESYFPNQYAVNGTHIPSLQHVIDFTNKATKHKIYYQIEIKNDPNTPNFTASPDKLAQELYKVIKKNHLVNRVEVQAFDWSTLYAIQKLDKHIKTAYLVGYDDKTRMLNADKNIAGKWSGGKLLKDYDGSLPKMVKALGGACYEPEDVALTKEELEQSHKLGLKVVVWTWPEHVGTAFNAKVIDKLIKWGIDGIIIDDPARLNAMLSSRGMATPQKYYIYK